jgi:hypothetical protein
VTPRLSDSDLTSLEEAMLKNPLDTADLRNIQAAIEQLDQAVAVRRDHSRPWSPNNRVSSKAVVIIAPSRSGKTCCIDYARLHLKPLQDAIQRQVSAPFQINAPSYFTVEDLGRSLLGPMNLLPARSLGPGQTMNRLYTRVGLRRPRMVHIDEFQRALTPERTAPTRRHEAQVKIFSHIRDLLDLPAWPLPLVLSGTMALKEAMERPDLDFIRERCKFIELPSMAIDNEDDRMDLAEGLAAYCETVEMQVDTGSQLDFFARLILASNYNRGLAFEICREAILVAAQHGRVVKPEHFAAFYAQKVGCFPIANPFYTSNWKLVKPGALFAKLVADREGKK